MPYSWLLQILKHSDEGYICMEIRCNSDIFFCKQDIQLQEEKVGDMSEGNIQCVDADHHNLHSHTLQSPKRQWSVTHTNNHKLSQSCAGLNFSDNVIKMIAY